MGPVEKLARELCKQDGRNPDSIYESVIWKDNVPAVSRTPWWKLYEYKALEFLPIAQKVYTEGYEDAALRVPEKIWDEYGGPLDENPYVE